MILRRYIVLIFAVCVALSMQATNVTTSNDKLNAPVILEPLPAVLTAFDGDEFSISIDVSGSEPLSYKWEIYQGSHWNEATEQTSNFFYIDDISWTLNRSKLRVTVSNSAGSIISNEADLIVYAFPVNYNMQPADRSCNEKDTIIFSSMVSGSSPISYQWQEKKAQTNDFLDIPGATELDLVISPTSNMDGNEYRMVAMNAGGSVESSSAKLTVYAFVPDKIALNYSNLKLKKEQTEKLIPTLSPENIVNKSIKWESENPEIAKVDQLGNIKAIANGSTTIIARTANDITAKCEIIVK